MGEIKGQWLEEEQKLEILSIVAQAKANGLSLSLSCSFWKMNRRRVVRWRTKKKRGQSLNNLKPGPRMPAHKLLPEEIDAVLQMAVKKEYADLSHRTLAVTAWDLKIFCVSFSSVYRILVSNDLMSLRGNQGRHNGHSLKAIAWCISWYQTAEQARYLLEQGLINENILDLPEDQRPEIISDRGRQMKAKPIKKMFEDHHMPQLFSRPRTPNDNPFIESMFSTVKGSPQYPGRFLDLEQAVEYFNTYFPCYNSEHLHSGIDYVTPDQCHLGLRNEIVARRKAHLSNQRLFRKEVNRPKQIFLTQNVKPLFSNFNPVSPCSVIDP